MHLIAYKSLKGQVIPYKLVDSFLSAHKVITPSLYNP